MKAKLCRTCISYNPDDETPGFGTCGLSDCQVCEYAQGCIDWRNHNIGGPDYGKEKTAIRRNGH